MIECGKTLIMEITDIINKKTGMDKTEANKIVAEFMDYKTDEYGFWTDKFAEKGFFNGNNHIDNPSFNNRWDLLMPVWRKLRDILRDVIDTGYSETVTHLYDEILSAGTELTREFNDEHLLGATQLLRSPGQRTWTKHSVTFKTSPETRMVHIFFHKMDRGDDSSVIYDDIEIRELPQH